MPVFKLYPLFLAGMVTLLVGCQSAYFSAMEKVGYHKRDIMVDRIESSQTAQEEAQTQFKSALERFRHTVNFNGGDLEAVYNELNKEYERSVSAADNVRKRIDGVKSVSEALFAEWRGELKQYTNQRLRDASAKELKATERNYQQMLASLEKSEKQMQPILNAFHDQVLYLKHNLNARAISALKGEFTSIKTDIERLIQAMQTSINQSKQFVKTLKKHK
ncbi:DUF2959 domain-containing protein [Candidatus Sororendozoicomonas aggregata]|uniref:DUF2959 domain-containing protein n=1 Tax=Candidatus Sororendozoicomonas aggregata TaxID=3073239 RepID=UPI002ED56AA0